MYFAYDVLRGEDWELDIGSGFLVALLATASILTLNA